MIYCRECKRFRKILRYIKDDPILACGHVKCRSKVDDRIQKCADDIERFSVQHGIEITQLCDRLLTELAKKRKESNLTDYCPICDMNVTVILGLDGKRYCGGNLVNNPGCGRLLSEAIAEVS